MLGAIAGDTIGSVYEFRNTKDYDFPLFQGRSSFTDDGKGEKVKFKFFRCHWSDTQPAPST